MSFPAAGHSSPFTKRPTTAVSSSTPDVRSPSLHPSDQLFTSGVPTDLLNAIPLVTSIEALWELSKLPRAQNEMTKLAIMKQVKRLERRRRRIEREQRGEHDFIDDGSTTVR